MAAELHKIDRSEAMEFLQRVKPEAMLVIKMTSLFYGGYVNGTLALVAGIVIETLLDDEAYLWLEHDQSIVDQVPKTFARMAKRFVEELPYELIRGHTSEPYLRLIQFLGGELVGTIIGNLFPFEIRKQNG